MIFVIALAIIVILSAMLLVFARSMRTAALASANQLSADRASAVEQGAERWVLAQIDQNSGDPTTITQVPAEALQVGDGYFWILRFYPDDDQQYDFGITDESTKINLNTANADDLLQIPGMTEDLTDAVIDWRDTDDDTGGQGAESDYYESLADPYQAKNSPFETTGELQLVKGFTPDLLFGYDLNHNGVLDPAESAAGGAGTTFSNLSGDSRGLFNYVTAYGATSTGAGGNQNSAPSGGGQENAGPSGGSGASGGRSGGSGGSSNGGGGDSGGRGSSGRGGGGAGGASGGGSGTPSRSGGGSAGSSGQTDMYSADIVAVTANGRAYKRVRIVVNAKQSPARIVYRKDLSGLGWPLPDEIRTALRGGQPPPTGLGVSGAGVGSLPLGQ